jgi:hypothetical protein
MPKLDGILETALYVGEQLVLGWEIRSLGCSLGG